MLTLLLVALMFCVSIISGMLGIGVAFAAIPILGIYSQDLVHEVQPIALFLNGITALFASISFGRAGYIDWPRSSALALVATIFAPIGALVAQYTSAGVVWSLYFAALAAVIFLLLCEVP